MISKEKTKKFRVNHVQEFADTASTDKEPELDQIDPLSISNLPVTHESFQFSLNLKECLKERLSYTDVM